MAQIKGEQYLEGSWTCPQCGTFYPNKKIGLTIHSFWPRYRFCDRGCARYFNIKDEDITMFIERKRNKT